MASAAAPAYRATPAARPTPAAHTPPAAPAPPAASGSAPAPRRVRVELMRASGKMSWFENGIAPTRSFDDRHLVLCTLGHVLCLEAYDHYRRSALQVPEEIMWVREAHLCISRD